MEQRFKHLISIVSKSASRPNLSRIEKAWELNKLAHIDQKRLSGEPYAQHPLEVAIILAGWKLDEDSIIAGLLHDSIDDGGATKEDLLKEFGAEVALLVEGVSKVASIRWNKGTQEHFTENLRKMVLFMAKDIRVVLIKIADRIHNMRTLWALADNKRARIARETLEIYAPLAERLGMGEASGELNDLSFKYLYPQEYEELVKKSRPFYKTASAHIRKMHHTLLRYLSDENIKAIVQGRQKRLYSLWRKLSRPEIDGDFNKIHDIVALRILVDTTSQCYAALGVVHAHFRPVPYLGVSDFIAQPKPNGYQSIHTKVFGPGGRIVEVQIRTYAMHEQAEYGVASHWAYSQAKSQGASDKLLEEKGVSVDKEKLGWVRQLVEWQKELTDSKEFLEAVKFDAFSHRNFVFSPKGDVYDLPANATPVDFAFAVHTDLPEYIQSAKVNGKIVPLNYKLKSGDIVEIIKSKNKKPLNRDWLAFVVTSAARRQINKQLRKGRQQGKIGFK